MTFESADAITAVFVYGTLKTGQCREKCWPCDPTSLTKAWTHGELYDTGPYPALIHGSDLVGGELWQFAAGQMPLVLADLDIVEEYRPDCEATNLYNRVVIECVDRATGRTIKAFTYIYARQNELAYFARVLPTVSWQDQRFAVWPDDVDW